VLRRAANKARKAPGALQNKAQMAPGALQNKAQMAPGALKKAQNGARRASLCA